MSRNELTFTNHLGNHGLFHPYKSVISFQLNVSLGSTLYILQIIEDTFASLYIMPTMPPRPSPDVSAQPRQPATIYISTHLNYLETDLTWLSLGDLV